MKMLRKVADTRGEPFFFVPKAISLVSLRFYNGWLLQPRLCRPRRGFRRRKKSQMSYQDYIRYYPNFPKEGITFIDWMPIMAHAEAFASLIDDLAALVAGRGFTKVAAIEARGLMLGIPLSERLHCGFVPLRKAGKLPGTCFGETYDLEYGTAAMEMQHDMVKPTDKVLVVDDLLALGGTLVAANRLVGNVTNQIEDLVFIRLTDLPQQLTEGVPLHCLLEMQEKA